MTHNPRSTYLDLLAQRRASIAALERRHRSFGYAKLAVAFIGVLLVWFALSRSAAAILWVLVPIAAFAVLVVLHDRLLKRMERLRRAIQFFDNAIARIDGKWAGNGETGERYLNPEHPYASDLDLFGKGSLFELICTARTLLGQDTLAAWLQAPAPPNEVRARQEAADDWRRGVALRKGPAIRAEGARSGVHPAGLAAWGETPARLRSGSFRAQVHAFTALGIAGFVALWIHLSNTANAIQLSDGAAPLAPDLFLITLVINGWHIYRWSGSIGHAVRSLGS